MIRPLSIGARGVAACVIDGLSRRQTAAATGLRASAVLGHLRTLRRRFDADSTRDLALRLQWCDWREVETPKETPQ